MRTNFVLIDYENVQPATIETLNYEHVRLLIFVGANQTKVPIEIAVALQQLGERASYVKISSNGNNALDFHIAFYIGQLAAQEPNAYFHIVSKDTGFDPLIQHLKTKKILAKRVQAVSEIPTVKVALATTPSKQIEVIITNLQQRGSSKPGTIKTLSSTINAIFAKTLSEPEIASLINQLKNRGIIQVENTKVSYKLPT
ncbi:PIN domain-containing protein [Herpetosiphon sp. NSE202]|uniref:PIN domain-containing protein n=1 Tax=Herpetosiphon sp. NSE202 TaxID=3351349 RepID=UPI00362539B4